MNKRAMIVIFSVVIVVLLVVLIWGISVRDGWNGWGWRPGWDRAGLSTGTTFEYDAAQVEQLDLNLLSEDVRIEPADGTVIRVEQIASWEIPADRQIYCGLQGSRLTVQSGPHSWVSCGFNDMVPSTVQVSVPRDKLLELGVDVLSGRVDVGSLAFRDLSVETASGSVAISGASAPRMSAETASGSVRVQAGVFDSLQCETASGSIDIDAEVAGEVGMSSMSGSQRFQGRCDTFATETASGDVDAEIRGASSIEAKAMSGSLELECTDASRLRLVDAQTASGSVTLAVPEGTTVSLDYETMSGDLRLDESGVVLGSSGIEVNIETSSGDLNIRSHGRSRSSL